MNLGVQIAELPGDVRGKWEIPERVLPSVWAQEHLRIPAESSPTPGRMGFEERPYMVEPLDAWADPEVREVTLKWGTQLGKTTLLMALAGFTAGADPGPMLIVGAVEQSVKDLFTTRLYRMLEVSPLLAGLMLPRHERLDLLIDLRAQLIYSGWSGSVSRIGEKPIRYLLCTEIDKWSREKSMEGDSLALARERTKAFTNFKQLYESTPTLKNVSRIEASFEASDRRQFHVPCPHCGVYGPLIFGVPDAPGGLKWPHRPDGHSVSAEEARLGAWYQCPACRARIGDGDKFGMLRRGVWVPKGQRARVARAEEVNEANARGAVRRTMAGDDVIIEGVAEHPSSRHRGYHLSSLYSPALTWGDIAAEWLKAKGDHRLEQNFYNGWLAEVWDVTPDALPWQELAERCADPGRPAGVVPADAEVLIATSDVGKERIHYVVRAWDSEGRSWLVAWGECGSFEDLHMLTREAVFRGEDGSQWAVAASGMDARYRTDEVDAYVIKTGPTARAFMGDRLKDGTFKRFAVQADAITGKPVLLGHARWFLNSDHFKERLQSMQNRPVDHPVRWLLAADVDENYLKQVTSEARVLDYDNRGREVYKWTVLHTSPGNHLWDCEYYQLAAWDMWRGGWCRLRRRERQPYGSQAPADDRRSTGGLGGRSWDGTL